MSTDDSPRSSARDAMIIENMGFVRALARRYAGRGESIDDLVQVGMLGLVNAADRFDPGYGTDFRSFATPTVLGELRRYFRDRSWSVRVPRRIKDDLIVVSAAIEQLPGPLGRTPNVAEVARATGLAVDRVLDALAARSAYRPDSLSHAPWLEDEETTRDVAVTDEHFGLADDRMLLAEVLPGLNLRERVILHLRFEAGLLQSQIAEVVGVSQMHVSRLITRALDRLRASAEGSSEAGMNATPSGYAGPTTARGRPIPKDDA